MMTQSYSGRYWKLGLAIALAINGVCAISGNYALAKSDRNGTLKAECVNSPNVSFNSLSSVEIERGKNTDAYLFQKNGIFQNYAIADRGQTQLARPQSVGINQNLKFERFLPQTSQIPSCVYYPECPDGRGGPCFMCT